MDTPAKAVIAAEAESEETLGLLISFLSYNPIRTSTVFVPASAHQTNNQCQHQHPAQIDGRAEMYTGTGVQGSGNVCKHRK